jgi:beta-glucosidase-like glycosyl hydrolase
LDEVLIFSNALSLVPWQVMVPNNYDMFINSLTNLVNMNVIPMSRINDAVRRILRVKFVMGLFENPLADLSMADQIGKKVIYNYKWKFSVIRSEIILLILIFLKRN